MKNWYPGSFVHSIMIGADPEEDRKASFFDQIHKQVESVCDTLKKIPELKDGFDALGFSQGGLFFRAYVQQCNDPPVRNLISFGSPHGGVSDVPNCQDKGIEKITR
jgi:palmitoyl-protein thioesterase